MPALLAALALLFLPQVQASTRVDVLLEAMDNPAAWDKLEPQALVFSEREALDAARSLGLHVGLVVQQSPTAQDVIPVVKLAELIRTKAFVESARRSVEFRQKILRRIGWSGLAGVPVTFLYCVAATIESKSMMWGFAAIGAPISSLIAGVTAFMFEDSVGPEPFVKKFSNRFRKEFLRGVEQGYGKRVLRGAERGGYIRGDMKPFKKSLCELILGG